MNKFLTVFALIFIFGQFLFDGAIKALVPEAATKHISLGQTHYGSKNFEAAVIEYKKALELMPENLELISVIGNIYHRMGQYENAVAILATMLEISPKDQTTKNDLDLKLSGYLSLLREMTVQNQENFNFWNQMAMVSSRLNLHTETIESAQKAISINPDLPQSHLALAKAYKAIRQFDKAYIAIEKARSLRPDDVEILDLFNEISQETARSN